jgi:hypothetical protein
MAEYIDSRSEAQPELRRSEPTLDYADAPQPLQGLDVLPFPMGVAAGSELAPLRKSKRIRLNFAKLQPFELVNRQFQRLGVTFANAIALSPSNPAYPPYVGRTVIMGSPRGGWLEAKFDAPVKFVSSCVTSSRPTVMAAFDGNNQRVAQTEMRTANLAGSTSELPPNVELRINGEGICRVTFYSFDGQLTVGEFSFGA